MNLFRHTVRALIVTTFLFGLCAVAQAQLRVFVASTGSDVNACTRTAPCRNFQRAHDVAAAGGEIVPLDAAGYGSVSITKAITINGSGGYAGITVGNGGTGVNVATGGLVVLRGLQIIGNNAGNNTGVNYVSGGLVIDNCQFTQLTIGLNVTNGKINVIDSNFHGNGTGINASGTGHDPNNQEASATLVLVRGGNIAGNTVGITQNNAGLNSNNNAKTNILMFNSGANFTNLVNNGTNGTCTGMNCQAQPGTYSFNQTMN